MRFGWMRLRCPTSVATPVLSRQSLVAPPAFPPIQANPSLSRLSSYSCATLICNMRLPGGDVLMKRARVGIGRKFLAQLAVAQHLCELGQDAQVLLGRLFRHQKQEHEADGLAVGRVEWNRLCQAHESPDCLNMRFLLVTSRSRRMFEGGRSLATRFISETRPVRTSRTQKSYPAARKGVEFYTIGAA